jgi:diguanylate cyclase (GGDEF)-like protein/PAS domain S-box-containing protein
MRLRQFLAWRGEVSPEQAQALRRIRWLSAVMFAGMLGIGGSVLWVDWQAQVQARQRATSEVVAARAAAIQQRLNTAVSATYALAAVLRQNDYRVDPQGFETLAAELLRYHPGISSLQYAPGGIITHVVPLAGHERAIGHNLIANTDRNKEARLAIETRTLTVAGPFNLVQGGVGLAGRLPIFRPRDDGREGFWGFAVALIRVPELLEAAQLARLGDLGNRYRLWRVHPDTGEPQVFAADSVPFDALPALADPVSIAFDVPNGRWHLSAEPLGGWASPSDVNFIVKGLLVVFVALALTLTLFLLLRLPLVLGSLVTRRTQELEASNAKLAEEIAVRREVEEQLRLGAKVFESSAESIMITDRNDRIVSVNDAFIRITGFSREEAIGQPAILLDSGRHDAEFLRVMDEALVRDGRWQGEIWSRRKSGELFPQWLGISVLADENGKVTHYVSIASDITERKASAERIHYLAHYDALTGLPNRVLLRDRVQQAMVHADRQRTQIGLLLLDLDRFKFVNESLGHDLGDMLLQRVVDRLREAVRTTDTISRQGGDEFLVVIPDQTGANAATRVAEKILRLLAQPFLIEGHEVRVTASIGIAIYPDDGSDFDTLMKLCDIAMYFAKESGRATYRLYTQAMKDNSADRLAIEAELARAVDEQQFELHYQPQVRLDGERIIGAEALIRWRHPEKGLVPPGRFIPVAEETGLIGPIGDWVLHEACRQATAWRADGLPPMLVSVNLSGLQFRREGLAKQVADVLASSGLEAEYLELELTESILLQDVENVMRTMRELKAIGVKLAIDDFGTGYSSLSYLKRFSVDKLKIDQSFIRDLCIDSDDAAIVKAVIELGKSMNLETIAEGTETREQVDALRAQGCMHVQGYFFSKPLPAAEFAAFVRSFGAEAANAN